MFTINPDEIAGKTAMISIQVSFDENCACSARTTLHGDTITLTMALLMGIQRVPDFGHCVKMAAHLADSPIAQQLLSHVRVTK